MEDEVDVGGCPDDHECVICAPQGMPKAFYCKKEVTAHTPGSTPSGDTSEFSE